MVFLTLTKSFNQWVGPFLLRNGLKARYVLGGGVIRDNPSLDGLLLLPLAQKLISLEAREDMQQAVSEGKIRDGFMDTLFRRNKKKDQKGGNLSSKEEKLDEATLRVRVLERYLRPALAKNEQWSDVRKWQFNHRFIKWARTEYLLAKHGPRLRAALEVYPALRKSPQISIRQRGVAKLLAGKLPFDNDDKTAPTRPPPTSLVKDALQLRGWKQHKNLPASGKRMARIARSLGGDLIELRGGSMRFVITQDDASLEQLSLEDILEVTAGHVSTCGPLNALCEEADIYQLWTQEYVEALGAYLLKRTRSFSGETVVLDVGAGDGLLAQFLRDNFEHGPSKTKEHGHRRPRLSQSKSRRPSKIPRVIATDDGSWHVTQKAPVERLSVEESIRKYSDPSHQLIVLCSWMPMGIDWSSIFREHGVNEYILIGECDDGQCGDNWLTWGNRHYLDDDELAEDIEKALGQEDSRSSSAMKDPERNSKATMRPYEVNNYMRKDLDSLLPYQFSRFDCSASKFGRTVSFRRAN